MKTINIGNLTKMFIAEKANTTYVLEKGDIVDAGSSSRAIYTNDDLVDVSYQIAGTVKGKSGLRIYTPDVDAATTVNVEKSGRIIAAQDGIDSYGDGHVIRNDGRISSLDASGVSAFESQTVINTGSITGKYAGIMFPSSADDVSVVRNSGTISGESYSIRGSDGAEKVINSGVLEGDVVLAEGTDTFVFLSGSLDGTVFGGIDDDTYILRRPGVDIREATGVAGGQDLVKAAFSMSLASNFEDLTLLGTKNLTGIGNGSDNTLIGNAGGNTLMGGEGNDILKGGRGNDVLAGGNGDDAFHFGFGTGMDIVSDYAWATDELHLDGLKGATDYADMIANHISQKGNDLWITYGGDVIVLANSDASDLNTNFVFFD